MPSGGPDDTPRRETPKNYAKQKMLSIVGGIPRNAMMMHNKSQIGTDDDDSPNMFPEF
jgi:hypothetical protein